DSSSCGGRLGRRVGERAAPAVRAPARRRAMAPSPELDGCLTVLGDTARRSVSRGANPGTDSQFPANCAGNLVSVPGLRPRTREPIPELDYRTVIGCGIKIA